MIRFSRKLPMLALSWSVLFLVMFSAGNSSAADEEQGEKAAPAPSANEQIVSLEGMCAQNAEAMAAADSAKSLYERLGGREGIHKIVAEVVRLHGQNKDFDRFMDEVDTKHLIEGVTQFMVSATGGPGDYEGPSLAESHAHLKLTNADFLSAGHDVMQGMKNMGCKEAEINELICMFVSLRDQVVIDSDKELD